MTNNQKLKKFYGILEEFEAYARSIGKVRFDMECVAPEEGLEQAATDMSVLGKRCHSLLHSKTFVKLLCELHDNPEGLTDVQKATIRHFYDDYIKTKNQSADFAYRLSLAENKAYSKWLEAKKANDFSIYRDSFADIIDYTRQAIELKDNKKGSYYDNCLDCYEKGGNEVQLDIFFAALKERIVPLMRQIEKEGKLIREDFMSRPCPIPKQEELSRYLLELQGLRKSALVLMTTEHPFTENFGPNDVRVTTHYYENNFISNVFSTLHEGGHALFMQNEPDEFYREHAANSMSNGMHECISRFYENIVGRSEAFIHFIYPKLRELGGDILADVSESELYEAVNIARPSLIRVEADELTYSLHIMIRYEIEKEFINGRITVDEIPALWNAKYKEYLGVNVPSDDVGCLQDVHWTGMFGYFPSYALGNAYGVQILRTMEKDFDVNEAIASGNLAKIAEWLKANVFSFASVLDPDEWIRRITGESLNVSYYLDYLEKKYKALYGLK